MRTQLLKGTLILLAVVCLGAQFVRPARTNPFADPAASIRHTSRITPRAAAVLERACRDCHSNDTRWPWYSNVAPVSWFVIDHVHHARRHMNFSTWRNYSGSDIDRLLKNTCDMAAKNQMPLSSYTLIHRHSRLNADDVQALCEWTSAERKLLSADASRMVP